MGEVTVWLPYSVPCKLHSVNIYGSETKLVGPLKSRTTLAAMHNKLTATAFVTILEQALQRGISVQKIQDEFGIAASTVQRWRLQQSLPHEEMWPKIADWLEQQ